MTQDIFKKEVFIHRDKMFRYAKSILANEDEAFDLVQEVMLSLWSQREKLDHIENIEAFAMRSVYNRAVNIIKRSKVVQLHQNELTSEVQREEYPALTKELVLKLIQELPDKQKAVMHLRDIEEYDIHEMEELLGMKESAIRVNLMRARQKVRKQLKKVFDYEKRQIEGIGR